MPSSPLSYVAVSVFVLFISICYTYIVHRYFTKAKSALFRDLLDNNSGSSPYKFIMSVWCDICDFCDIIVVSATLRLSLLDSLLCRNGSSHVILLS